jgi:hypothetical protein
VIQLLQQQLLQYSDPSVRFLFVYIDEAHAADQWAIGDPREIKQSRSDQERMERASVLVPFFRSDAHILVEPLDQPLFSKFYAPWPTQAYAISVDLDFLGSVEVRGGRFDQGFADLFEKTKRPPTHTVMKVSV